MSLIKQIETPGGLVEWSSGAESAENCALNAAAQGQIIPVKAFQTDAVCNSEKYKIVSFFGDKFTVFMLNAS